ncbi:hypothetical protein [Caloramator sp. Dgby_cultured_2]|uniref:hypothetical protein n=1 Tax=Caloramator sp. Dgby_cultured_2 TaxID=3029174 RepID=UPI00237DCD92|nr:hypothetical protein [Caloramator sp. Dgby_cultured_2]WDU82898.1 hypothetical protein PWK10_15835 [Caloramator sp. Dgby_cultured_2]
MVIIIVENNLRYRLILSYFSIIFLLVFLINVSIYYILQKFYIDSKKNDVLFAAKTSLDYIDVYNNKVDLEKLKEIQRDVYSRIVIVLNGKVVYDDFNKILPLSDLFKKK